MQALPGILGLLIGLGLYALIARAPDALERPLYLLFFVAFGIGVFLWGRGDRTIQMVGGIIALYGVLRSFLL